MAMAISRHAARNELYSATPPFKEDAKTMVGSHIIKYDFIELDDIGHSNKARSCNNMAVGDGHSIT